jgi:hypothetical protein
LALYDGLSMPAERCRDFLGTEACNGHRLDTLVLLGVEGTALHGDQSLGSVTV